MSALRRFALLIVLGVALSARAEEWIKLTAQNFTIVSTASESKTRAWATEFELFKRGIAHFFPVNSANLPPVTIILFGSDGQFKPYKPLENGRPAKIGGYFVHNPGRNVLATSIDGGRDEVRERIYHEATHWYLSAYDRELPLWLNEGLAEVFGTFTFQGSTFRVGDARSEYVHYVRVAKPMPFAKLMAVPNGGLKFNGENRDQTLLFYVQSWATAHLLMFGDDQTGLGKLRYYLAQAPTGEDPAAELLRIFGRKAEDFDRQLPAYLERRALSCYSAPLDRNAAAAGFQVHPATAVDVELALGSLLLGANRPADAAAHFHKALATSPDLPEALLGLGEVELYQERPREALEFFNTAQAKGGNSFVAHFFTAYASFDEAQENPLGVSSESLRPAFDHLATSIQLNPRFPEAYDLLGLLVGLAPENATPTITAFLQQGLRRFPQHPELHLGLGFIDLRAHRLDAAQKHSRMAQDGLGHGTFPFSKQAARLELEIAEQLGTSSPETAPTAAH